MPKLHSIFNFSTILLTTKTAAPKYMNRRIAGHQLYLHWNYKAANMKINIKVYTSDKTKSSDMLDNWWMYGAIKISGKK